jgi:hypothetical protein
MIEAIAATILIILHTGDGSEININPAQVTSLRKARPADHFPSSEKYFSDKVRCMVNLTDGKFLTVIEECEAIRKMLQETGVDK